jgi:predicted KAP-like P-loop ATPase
MGITPAVPQETGDLKKDYQNLLDYVIKLSKSLDYQLTHLDNTNTVYGRIAINEDFLFLNISGGEYLGETI